MWSKNEGVRVPFPFGLEVAVALKELGFGSAAELVLGTADMSLKLSTCTSKGS